VDTKFIFTKAYTEIDKNLKIPPLLYVHNYVLGQLTTPFIKSYFYIIIKLRMNHLEKVFGKRNELIVFLWKFASANLRDVPVSSHLLNGKKNYPPKYWKLWDKIIFSEIEKHQRNLNKSIEALGDILVFQTKNKKENKIVKDGLRKIAEIVNMLLKFQKDDLFFFKKFIFSSEYNNLSEIEKLVLSHLFTEEASPILTTIINQFQRINETATEVKNIEIINQSIWRISYILVDLTSIEHNKFNNIYLIEQFLKKINDIRFFLLNQQGVFITYSSYSSSIEWYTLTVFKIDYKERKFNINYLPLLSKYLWESIKSIIDNDKFDIFKSLTFDVQNLNQDLIDINEDKYLKKDEFKFNNLMVILFYMAAYCLFKKKFDYIQYLWNYNQPLDADATWIHRDVVPLGTFYIIIFFFNNQIILGKHYRWDDHHGSSRYLKQYLILLLIRSLYTKKQPEIDQLIHKGKIIFENLNKNCLNDMKFMFLEECINTAKEIKNNSDNKTLLNSLNFEVKAQVDSVIDRGIIPIFNKIKEQT
jgi:hypothetical protein